MGSEEMKDIIHRAMKKNLGRKKDVQVTQCGVIETKVFNIVLDQQGLLLPL